MKRSILLLVMGTMLARSCVAATADARTAPASQEEERRGGSRGGELRAALVREGDAVRNGDVDAAWTDFLSVRARLVESHEPPGATLPGAIPSAAASTGDDLEPALIALGRAFLQQDRPEAAIDVWRAAQARGSRSASSYLVDAIHRKGWPVWIRSDGAPVLPAQAILSVVSGAAISVDEKEALPSAEDPLYRQTYRCSLSVYLPAASGLLWQRFLFHYRRNEDGALARELAKDFAALYVLVDSRLGRGTRFSPEGRVEIWLATDGVAGGEQWKEHLFFYALSRPRSHLEWMREAAHEYGHECLPGAAGFVEPEGWADGELGERLFLRWLDRGTAERGAMMDQLGLKSSGLEAYLSRFARPLVDRFAANGWRPDLMEKRDRAAMEQLIGLALWAEDAHGASFLRSMLSRMPDQGPSSFWHGYLRAESAALDSAGGERFRVAPVNGTLRWYLPSAGRYRVMRAGGGHAPLVLADGRSATPIRVVSGEPWSAAAGWYAVDSAPGSVTSVTIERIAGPEAPGRSRRASRGTKLRVSAAPKGSPHE